MTVVFPLPSPPIAAPWTHHVHRCGACALQGPIYVQGAGGAMLLAGFVNYFAFGNANGLSSPLWTLRYINGLRV